MLTDTVFKLRSPQLRCGSSLETQLQILASAHPWLLASGGHHQGSWLPNKNSWNSFMEHRGNGTMVPSPGTNRRLQVPVDLPDISVLCVCAGDQLSPSECVHLFMCLNTRSPLVVLVSFGDNVEPSGHGT